MSFEPLEEVYFDWLYSKVASTSVSSPRLTHYTLLKGMHEIEFVWLLSGDDNRAEDGVELRHDFIRETDVDCPEEWLYLEPSLLEVLIGLAHRTAFQSDKDSMIWFWIFMDNLGLSKLTDDKKKIIHKLNAIADRFIWRTYLADGRGGVFPLENPKTDQRKEELWVQMCAYLFETDDL